MNLRKWLVTTAIVLIMLPLSIQAAEKVGKKVTPESLSGAKVIDTDTVKKWLDAGEDFFILDARKAPDYEAGHLPEAEICTVPSDLNIEDAAIKASIAVLEKDANLKDLEKDTKIVTYCNNYT